MGQDRAAQLYSRSQQPQQGGLSGPLWHLQKSTWAQSRMPPSTGWQQQADGLRFIFLYILLLQLLTEELSLAQVLSSR